MIRIKFTILSLPSPIVQNSQFPLGPPYGSKLAKIEIEFLKETNNNGGAFQMVVKRKDEFDQNSHLYITSRNNDSLLCQLGTFISDNVFYIH